MKRCEPWPKDGVISERVLVLTVGVDVQRDRLEIEVVGWAGGEESWSIDYHVIHGDPDIPEGTPGSPWTDLTNYLRRLWKNERGIELKIDSTCIDSAGSNTQAVYQYVKAHRGARIFAIIGRAGSEKPIIGSPMRRRWGKKTQRAVDVYTVGVDQAKLAIYRRLQITNPGPGYCHFPIGRNPEYFRGLTAEKMLTRYVKGFPKIEFRKPSKARNEPLDCRVYAFAALVMLSPQFDEIACNRKQEALKKKTTGDKEGELCNSESERPQSRITYVSRW